MEGSSLINANPIVYEVSKEKDSTYNTYEYANELERDALTSDEIFGNVLTITTA